LDGGSVENRRRIPVTACETEEEREGVLVPEEDGVPRSRSWCSKEDRDIFVSLLDILTACV
jgi:hypothetical protein